MQNERYHPAPGVFLYLFILRHALQPVVGYILIIDKHWPLAQRSPDYPTDLNRDLLQSFTMATKPACSNPGMDTGEHQGDKFRCRWGSNAYMYLHSGSIGEVKRGEKKRSCGHFMGST